MQLNNMDCTGRRSNNAERDSDLGEDLSQDDHSDDSVDSHHHGIRSSRLKVTSVERSNGGDMSFGGAGNSLAGGVGLGVRTPDHHSDLQMSHHHQFPPNHPLNALGNFMGIGSLHGIPNLQHNDVLEKLKMQVRDIKVGLMEQDYAAAHAAAFAPNLLPTTINPAFSLPPTSIASFEHRAQAMAAAGGGNGSIPNGSSAAQQHSTTNTTTVATSGLTNGGNGAVGIGSGGMVAGGGAIGVGIGGSANGSFSFTSPTVPSSKDVNPASNSSTSSEASNSSQQNNGWSFEEQYKQVRQLYEINDDPKRKEFLDDLFSFMQKRGTPINRLPIMAKSVLDLYELYNLVIARGGLVDVINKKLWQEIIKGLHLPSSITSAAFTLRTQYMKYLYPYECDKKNLSTPSELQAAIDGNRREGRRSSYGQYEAMHSQMQMPQIGRQALPAGMQQMTPLALVTHAANNHQAQAAAAAAAAHHRLMAPTFGQMPHLVSHELEQRMMEYLKIMQVKSEQGAGGPLGAGATDVASRVAGAVAGVVGGGGGGGGGGGSGVAGSGGINAGGSHPAATGHSHSSQSPELSTRDALNALEMSRVAFWQMYHNNTSPPASMSASPHPGGVSGISGALGDQHSEALNLSDSPPNVTNIKRERVRDNSPDVCDRDNFHHQPPPPKRAGSGLNFPTSFYLPPGMAAAAAAAAANFHHHKSSDLLQDSDAEDNDEDGDAHNTTGNSSSHGDGEHVRGHVNGHHRHHHNSHHLLQNPLHLHSSNGNSMSANHDKSDDSAIENSPSTSGASASGSGIGVAGAVVGVNAAGNGAVSGGHISPISTKKIHLSKPQTSLGNGSEVADRMSESGATNATGASLSDMDTLSLLTGMQFRVARNGVGANGEPQLIVNLELNGMKYSGVLIANTTAATETAEPMDVVDGGNSINTNIHISNDNVDMNEAGITQDEDIPDAESTASIEETPTKTSNGSAATSPAHTNGPTTLKDSLMPSESVDELASRNKDHSEKIKMLTF